MGSVKQHLFNRFWFVSDAQYFSNDAGSNQVMEHSLIWTDTFLYKYANNSLICIALNKIAF